MDNMKHQFIRFGFSGTLGFIVDAGVVDLLSSVHHINPFVSQGIGFLLAVTTTWYLNRLLTFPDSASPYLLKEWCQYFAANSVGAGINNGIYTVLVWKEPLFSNAPVLAVGIGSLAAMIFNFLAARRWVFVSDRRSL